MNRPSCSIIIRACNEERHIGRLLTGIRKQTVTPREVILVDSGSTDSTRAIAEQYGARIVTIAPAEFSFGRSLNFGCRAATGEFLVFASGHVYPLYTDWLETLLQPFADPTVVLTYGRQQGDERTRFPEHRVFAQWFPPEASFAPLSRFGAGGESHPKQDHPFCNNANAAIRRSAWEACPYDEGVTGLEDIDWAKRMMERGGAISYVSKASVAHVHEESSGEIMNRYYREAIAMKRIFPEQSFTFGTFLSCFSLNTLHDAVAALRERSFLKNLPDILRFRFLQFWGTYRGHRRRGAVEAALRRRFYYPRGFPPARQKGERDAGTERLIRYDDAHGQ